jgi:hypothetical protein
VALIGLAAPQQRQQILRAAVALQVVHLPLVVTVDEGFYRTNGGVRRARPGQRR